MTVRQVIDLAKSSELSGLPVASHEDVIVSFINLGVIELYKRFQLKVEEYIIELQSGVDIYTMPSNYMWMIAAYGEVDARSSETVNVLPINEEDNPLSVNTVGWNKVQVPVPIDGGYISIIYNASPDTYVLAQEDIEISIPIQMIEALLAYVGYKANAAIDTGVQTEDNVWYTRFENSCNKLREYGMFNNDDMFMSKRLGMRGFV